jgi:signal transduction histidine kinase
VVLREIAESACHLVDAPYGALGVLAPDRHGHEEFIHVGNDDETAAKIGHLPHGKGLLGALIVDDPHPIRLRDLTTDLRSVGFPDHHPPMRGFLGVPIRVRGEVFGNLYLADVGSREFTAEDEELVGALAATAGIAIANARLYDEARRRQRWLQASTEVTRELLTADGSSHFSMLAAEVHHLADADAVTVVLPTHDGQVKVVVAVGSGADQLTGMRYPREGTFAGHVLDTAEAVRIRDVGDPRELAGRFVHLATAIPAGPLMALPMIGADGPRGVLMVTRLHGRRPFTTADVEMTTTFAGHASIALELAEARRAQQQMVVLEDRARIARDLHDHVIQQLFGAGLTLQAALPAVPASASGHLEDVIDRLDDSIRQIRAAIFGLRPRTPVDGGLRDAVLDTVREASRALGFKPEVHFEGPVDLLADADLVGDVIAVTREALSNVARHAHARSVQVRLRATVDELTVSVSDDGIGMDEERTTRSGLSNLESRAHARHGTLAIDTAAREGTTLTWSSRLS